MFKQIGLVLLSALLILGIVMLVLRDSPPASPSGSQAPKDAFGEEGEFNDADRNRIYTIAFDPRVSAQLVRAYAAGLESADGRITAVYLYPEDSVIPLHSVTFASSIAQANHAIYESRGFSPWRYAFLRDPEGGVQFVDCRQTPKDGLCRKQ